MTQHLCEDRRDLPFRVRLLQDGPDRFTVIYGKQQHHDLTYAQAAREYGLAVLHALTCEGKVNVETK